MPVFYKKIQFSSMNKKLYIDDFIIWHENDNEKLPDVSFVPPMMRRRMTRLEKIAIGLAGRIAPQTQNYTVVFASRFGEWEQTIQLIRQFHSDKEMSPAGFSNSVHNAAAGAFSLLTKNTNTYTSIAAGDNTLEMAVLKALTSDGDVMVVFAGEHSPEIYNSVLKEPQNAFGLAVMLKTDGLRKIKVLSGDAQADILTMEKLTNFLTGKTNSVSTKTWTMLND